MAEILTERESVEAHRERRALNLGYDPHAARLLAESDADLHDLERLLDAGCSLSLAFEIVT